MGDFGFFRKALVVIGLFSGMQIGVATAQSQDFMMNECSSAGQPVST